MSTTTDTRQELHRLVDQLRDDDLYTAKRMLEYLHYTADPVRRVLLQAYHEEPEELTGEEAAGLDEAYDAVARGEVLSDDELRRELGW